MRLPFAVLALCFVLGVVLGTGTAAAGDAGFRDLKFTDSARGRTIPVALWYPSEDAATPQTINKETLDFLEHHLGE